MAATGLLAGMAAVARVSTGLGGLDAQLGGGVPAGTVHVLLGEPMNALELFGQHFASGGGEVVYASSDLSEAELHTGVRRVGGEPSRVRVVPLASGMPAADGAARIVLDSFSLHAQAIGWQEAYSGLKDLRDTARRTGAVALVVCTPALHDTREETLLRIWADGVMELGFDRQGFGLYPYLKVTKMRGVPDSARFLLFKETDRGLFMESTRRVF